MFAIYKKELKTLFISPGGIVTLGFYLLLSIIFFNGYFLGIRNTNDFSGFFSDMNTALIFILPILCARLMAEDKKLGTYELLLTSPVSSLEIILGKYLASLTFVSIGILLLLFYPVLLSFFVRIDFRIVISGFLGLIFTAGFFLSIGMFASAITDSYVASGLITFGIFILLFILSSFAKTLDLKWFNALKELSYISHYEAFVNGLIDLKNIIYFFSAIIFWLFLARNLVEVKLWKN